jgi:lipoprotein-releasing system permease protein
MRAPGFEWLVAWRHLRDPDRQSHKTLFVGIALAVLGVLSLAFVELAPRFTVAQATFAPGEWAEARTASWLGYVKISAYIEFGLASQALLLAALFESFTVFTAMSMFGVYLGTATPIIALSVMSGFENDLKTKIRSTKADVVIEMNDDRPFTDWQAVDAKLAGVPGLAGSMAYIEAEVIVKHATNAAGNGVVLRGIDPARATGVLGIGRTLKEGKVSYLEHPDQIPAGLGGRAQAAGDDDNPVPRRILPGILLGEELHQHILRVFVGSEVDVACPVCGVGPAGPMPKLKPFRVAGHFYTGMYEFDSKLAYVALRDAQKFLNMDGEVTGIEIRTVTPEAAAAAAKEIARRLGPSYLVRSWEELNSSLYAALRLEKLVMFIALCFIALVASFSIIANLIMMVTEKAREVAILKSMGARNGAILRIFFAEGLYIGLGGLALGISAGVAGCRGLERYGLPLPAEVYYIEKLPVVLRGTEVAAVGLAALALCCLATLYPAMLASRMRPVDGLRYE